MKITAILILFFSLSLADSYCQSIITEASYQYYGNDKSNNLGIRVFYGSISENREYFSSLFNKVQFINIGLLANLNFCSPLQINASLADFERIDLPENKSKNINIDKSLIYNFVRSISLKVLNYDQTGFYNFDIEWVKFGYGLGKNIFGLSEMIYYFQPTIGLTTLGKSKKNNENPSFVINETIFGIDYGFKLYTLVLISDYLKVQNSIENRNILPSKDFHEFALSGEITYTYYNREIQTDGPISYGVKEYFHLSEPKLNVSFRVSYLYYLYKAEHLSDFHFQVGLSYRLIDTFLPL
jgi:hypothetical protein